MPLVLPVASLALILWLGPRSIAILKESKEFEEIGAGATWKTARTARGFFESVFIFLAASPLSRAPDKTSMLRRLASRLHTQSTKTDLKPTASWQVTTNQLLIIDVSGN